MSKDIIYIRPSSYEHEGDNVVDVYLSNGEGMKGDLVQVPIGPLPDRLRKADPVFVDNVRSNVIRSLLIAARLEGLATTDVPAKVNAYFARHFPTSPRNAMS